MLCQKSSSGKLDIYKGSGYLNLTKSRARDGGVKNRKSSAVATDPSSKNKRTKEGGGFAFPREKTPRSAIEKGRNK